MLLIRKGLKGISWEEKKLLSAKIIDNDFFTIFNLLMIIENSKRIFLLNNKEVQELSYCNISQRKKIKQGISAKTFGDKANGTYRARKFYVKNVYSLDDYNLVNHLYNIAYPEFQRLIDDEAEDGFFRKSINYFKEKGMDKTVKALQDIHNKRKI